MPSLTIFSCSTHPRVQLTSSASPRKQTPTRLAREQVSGFNNAVFKGVATWVEAAAYVGPSQRALEVQRLVEEGADVTAINTAGETLLHEAARFCPEEVVRKLLDAGADVDAMNHAGETPEDSALTRSPHDPVRDQVPPTSHPK